MIHYYYNHICLETFLSKAMGVDPLGHPHVPLLEKRKERSEISHLNSTSLVGFFWAVWVSPDCNRGQKSCGQKWRGDNDNENKDINNEDNNDREDNEQTGTSVSQDS